MTKFKKVLLGCIGLCIFAVIFTVSCSADVQNAPGADEPSQQWHSGQHISEIYSQLGLTDEQKAQLKTTKQQHRVETEYIRREMKTDRDALQAELMKPQLDMPKINQIHGQIKVLESKMEDDRLNSILAVRAILTPEQFMEFLTLMHKHK